MHLQDFEKLHIPDTPGVYFFLGDKKEILYIGKATSLKDRVKSYFGPDLIATRGPLLVDMVFKAKEIKWQETDSVLEAMLLEVELIKKHQPYFNTKEKDNRSFLLVGITDEAFPRVVTFRKKDLLSPLSTKNYQLSTSFGPYPRSSQLKTALKIIRKIFPYRDEKCVSNQGKACFNYHIGLCPGVCIGRISEKEYAKTIQHIELFLSGKKKALVQTLTREMDALAKKQEFEEAGKIKNTLFALEHIQDVALIGEDDSVTTGALGKPFRIESYDVAHTSGKDVVGVMTVVINGEVEKSEYRKFKLSVEKNDDVGALKEILTRRLTHTEWSTPDLVVVDGGKAQLRVARTLVTPVFPEAGIVSVVKNEKHRPSHLLGDTALGVKHRKAVLLANAESHRFGIGYHRKLRGKMPD
ncbi:MAG: hypothetical protein RLZZ347_179 [Candidatus Parcubacteria bacterium]|jgi:excinuclease ABC subunit C